MKLDEDLLEHVRNGGKSWIFRSWEPTEIFVVLGRGNNTDQEVYKDRCQDDNIPILRRRGGGGAVVLSPGMLVLSMVKQVKHQYYFKEYFRQINDYIIDSLHHLGISELTQQGISDICLHGRKILGSSMYRSKDILFYTASLMISNDLQLLDCYLKHPSKEPDYRQGRSHANFVTNIAQKYPDLTLDLIKIQTDTFFQDRIPEII